MVILRLAAIAVLASCGDIGPYRCATQAQCLAANAAEGYCTPYGYCAFPDPSCPAISLGNGYRYDESAGPLAGGCVSEEPGPPPPCPEIEICGDGCALPNQSDTICPENDRPAGALKLLPYFGYHEISLAYSHDDMTPNCASPGGRDLFYEVDIPASAGALRLYLAIYTDFNSVLAVYSLPCAELVDRVSRGMSTSHRACIVGAACPDPGYEGLRVWTDNLDPGSYCMVLDQQGPADAELSAGMAYVIANFGPPAEQLPVPAQLTANTCTGENVLGSCQGGAATTEQLYFLSVCPGTLSASTCAQSPAFGGRLELFDAFGVLRLCTAGCDAGDPFSTAVTANGYWLAVEQAPAVCEEVVVDVQYAPGL